jgi:signal transduction histidine kinase/ligand-binding sensor domain-containing protein
MQIGGKFARVFWPSLILVGLILACSPVAQALNPELDVSQYAHTAWKVRDGFTQGTILRIAQTPDGYLWLGTEFGLYRFDGVRAIPWQQQLNDNFLSRHIYGLLVARDGTLWIGTDKGAASWKDGNLTRYPELDKQNINGFLEDREGTIWSAGQETFSSPKICAIRKGNVHCFGKDGSLTRGGWIANLYQDRKGNVWGIARYGIWKWKPSSPQFYPLQFGIDPLMGVAEDDAGNLLIGSDGGIGRFHDGKIQTFPLPANMQPFTAKTVLFDKDGSLWISAQHAGLVHIHQGRADVFRQADGLSSDEVGAIYEDREGNVWVATDDGLDRFRNLAVATLTVKQGLSNGAVRSVLADRDGSVWIATPDGLDRWRAGRITTYDHRQGKLDGSSPASIFQDNRGRLWLSSTQEIGYLKDNRFIPVTSTPDGRLMDVAEDSAGDIWISDQRGGLLHMSGDKLVERISWASLGHKDFALSLAADPSKSGIWIGFFEGGISYFSGGKIRETLTAANGLGSGAISHLQVEKDGTLWAATENGLSRMKDGRFITLDRKNGLPCEAIHWMIQDDDHSFWLDTQCGLLHLGNSEIDKWFLAASNGRPANLVVHPTVFDNSDGVRVHEQIYRPYNPPVTKTANGKIWFTPMDGVGVIDPRHLPFNNVPPPVHIEQVTADSQPYGATNDLRLPPNTHELTIDYTALSLAEPEKVHFRYRLQGQDPEWKEVVNERQVRYTNLGPGSYTFRVIAANNDGLWNETGAVLRFSIAPAYYQTTWFLLCCIAGVALLLWAAYLLRIRHLEGRFAAGLEARVDERTRIARDLHDTLLQSFQALLPHLQTVSNVLPSQPEEAKRRVDSAIEQATSAITDGRDTVHALRSGGSAATELDSAISNFAKELLSGTHAEAVPEIHVQVEGKPVLLNPVVRDEVYRIATEAVRNAIRHSNARRIEVEIRYDERHLRLRIGDNGTGIDPSILNRDHKLGHWGLQGMRERAKLVGGTLEVWSQPNVGTEIELSISAASVYAKPSSVRRSILSNFWRS